MVWQDFIRNFLIRRHDLFYDSIDRLDGLSFHVCQLSNLFLGFDSGIINNIDHRWNHLLGVFHSLVQRIVLRH
jgi:hypothetical protein